MSAEAFTTVLSCDIRTAPDGRSAEYCPAGEGWPRWMNPDGTIRRDGGEPGWATCYLYAEDVTRLAARAVREEPMDGLTGDHPELRDAAAELLEATSGLVRALALDAACDGALTTDRWAERLAVVQEALDHARALPVPAESSAR